METGHLKIGNLFDVSGRLVAITGAASGIGRMLARGCASNGASTILIDVNADSLEMVLREVRAISSADSAEAMHSRIQADLSTEAELTRVVAVVKSLATCLDCLIHCAGVRSMNKITYSPSQSIQQLESATLSASYKDWELTHRVNVMAPYYLTAGLVSLLGEAARQGEGRGSAILFSSPASVHNNQFVPSYQTSKAAVDHLVRIMAAEFASCRIRVNAMSPGIVPSAMTHDGPESNLHLAKDAPVGRAGTEDDMVGTALWLMSRAGAFMDGKVVRVEGGRLLILKGVTSASD